MWCVVGMGGIVADFGDEIFFGRGSTIGTDSVLPSPFALRISLFELAKVGCLALPLQEKQHRAWTQEPKLGSETLQSEGHTRAQFPIPPFPMRTVPGYNARQAVGAEPGKLGDHDMQSRLFAGAIMAAALVVCAGGAILSVSAFPARALASGAAAPPAQPTDACALLTQAQVSGVLGVSVGAGQRVMPNSAALCGWEVPGDKGMDRKRVVVSIYTQIGHLTPVDRFNHAKTPMKGITKEPVSGVGDDAVSATTPGFGTGLIFRKGASAFDVRVYGFPLDQVKAKEKTLALDVIARL